MLWLAVHSTMLRCMCSALPSLYKVHVLLSVLCAVLASVLPLPSHKATTATRAVPPMCVAVMLLLSVWKLLPSRGEGGPQ